MVSSFLRVLLRGCLGAEHMTCGVVAGWAGPDGARCWRHIIGAAPIVEAASACPLVRLFRNQTFLRPVAHSRQSASAPGRDCTCVRSCRSGRKCVSDLKRAAIRNAGADHSCRHSCRRARPSGAGASTPLATRTAASFSSGKPSHGPDSVECGGF